MAIIRRVFGPFKPEVCEQDKWEGMKRIQYMAVKWYFNGIRGDKTMAHWVLIFDTSTRKFSAANIKINDRLTGRSRAVLFAAKISTEVKSEDAHPDAWLDDRPVMEGNVVDILKQHLPPEEIARAAAASLLKGQT